MNNESYQFIWSDNWHIEGNKAWLVNGWRDVLLSLDLDKRRCNYLAQIPNANPAKFRLNSRCIKVGSEIFCMPDVGDSIWVYNLLNKNFMRILVDNPDHVRLSVWSFWCHEDKLFFLSVGLKKIGEINLEKKVIEQYYTLSDIPEEKLAHSIMVGKDVYCASSVFNKIYRFNLHTKEKVEYTVPKAENGFFTISFDGHKFWLSGYQKKIYIWNKEDNSVEILDGFPKDFGIYDFSGKEKEILNCTKEKFDEPLFLVSKVVGRYVWFIPFLTSQILYIDKETHVIQVFEIDTERETQASLLKNDMGQKFMVDYVMDCRYIGLFSFKNNWIVEIDVEEMKTKVKSFTFDCKQITEDAGKLSRYILLEKDSFDRALFNSFMNKKKCVIPNCELNIGKNIYEMISAI